MVRVTGGQIDKLTPDNLIAKAYPPTDSFVIELETPGAYSRGTVLSLESDGKYEVLGSGSGTASAVLSDDTLEDDDTAVAYRTGHFNRNALIMAENYELTATDENNLRLAGILLSGSMENAAASEGLPLADGLSIVSAAGTNIGDTALTVTPTKGAENSYKYKVGTRAESVGVGETLSGWSSWNGSAEITANTGKIITVVECDGDGEAVKAGYATVTAKAAASGLTVQSAEGSSSGKTKITVSPAKGSGNSYKYKVGDSAESVGVGDAVSDGWTSWNGTDDITATTGKKITVVECDGDGKAVKAGSATVTSAT